MQVTCSDAPFVFSASLADRGALRCVARRGNVQRPLELAAGTAAPPNPSPIGFGFGRDARRCFFFLLTSTTLMLGLGAVRT